MGQSNPPADRIACSKEVFGERFVHHRNLLPASGIHRRELAAGQDRDLHRVEEPGVDGVENRIHVLVFPVPVALNRDGTGPRSALHYGNRRAGHVRDAWQRFQPLLKSRRDRRYTFHRVSGA